MAGADPLTAGFNLGAAVFSFAEQVAKNWGLKFERKHIDAWNELQTKINDEWSRGRATADLVQIRAWERESDIELQTYVMECLQAVKQQTASK